MLPSQSVQTEEKSHPAEVLVLLAYTLMGQHSTQETWGKEPQGSLKEIHISSLCQSSVCQNGLFLLPAA